MVTIDRFGAFFKLFTVGSLAVVTLFVLFDRRERKHGIGEYYFLLLGAAIGIFFMVSTNNLLLLMLGLELLSLASYSLAGFHKGSKRSAEAALKYIVFGGLSAGVMLYGISLLYGLTGTIDLALMGRGSADGSSVSLAAQFATSPVPVAIAVVLVLAGFAYKVSVVPFHFWTPDVYEGAPTPVTGFMAAATKVAALVVALRVLVTAFPGEEELWTVALAVLVCASLAWGNLAALVQVSVKRMLAYSSISHAGFLLMPVAAGNELGGRALLYYLIPYSAMSVGAFAVVAIRERELAGPVTLGNLAGFGWERPFLGGSMALFMFGFIGLPPAGIFLGKIYAFAAVIDRGWAWLAIVGAVFTAVSIYYYAGVIRAMFMQPRELTVAPAGGSPPADLPLVAAVAAAVVVAVGSFVAADPLVDVARDAVAFLPFPVD
jgi:NADH-quinone oxidoreductase subunit N